MREDSLTTTRTTRSKTMTTKYAPNPMFSTEAALERLEPARADYLEKRQALEESHGELKALRSTLASHRQQAQAAQRQAEEAIRAAKGHETEETISLQEMAIRKERQIRVVESMVAAQEPAVELLKIDAHGARVTYLERLNQARLATDHQALEEQAEALFQSEAAAPLLSLLPSLMRRVEHGVYNDVGYMATQGVDITTTRGGGEYVRPWLSMAAQKQVGEKVRGEQLAAIGELVARFIGEPGAELNSQDEILEQIEPLPCEAQNGEFGSGIATARRRSELLAKVGERAA